MPDKPALQLAVEAESLKAVMATIENMKDDLDQFAPISNDSEMSHELVRWQTEDMHRHYPNVETPDPWTALTRIWPRSRRSKVHRPQPKGMQRQPRLRLVMPGGGRLTITKGAHRPILRPELFEKLADRMLKVMVEKLKWRSTSQP